MIIHFLHEHQNESTVPYQCIICGCRVTHHKKAWWHRTAFHGYPEHGPLSDTFQGSFVDLPVQCIAKEVDYLEHPLAIDFNPNGPQNIYTPTSESEYVEEPVSKKPCSQKNYEEEVSSVSDISTEQKDIVEAIMKGAEIAKHQGQHKRRRVSTESDMSIIIPPSGVVTSRKTVEEEQKSQPEIPTSAELVNELQ